jgi:hypothetical protein
MRAKFYLVATVIGFLVPPILITYYGIENSFDLVDMLNAMVDNTIALAVFLDVTISSIVFWVWAQGEADRLGIERWWLVIPVNIFVGLCAALPLFLYWREKALAAAPATS